MLKHTSYQLFLSKKFKNRPQSAPPQSLPLKTHSCPPHYPFPLNQNLVIYLKKKTHQPPERVSKRHPKIQSCPLPSSPSHRLNTTLLVSAKTENATETMPSETQTETQQPETPPNFWGYAPVEEYYASQGVTNTQSYFETPNGKLFTQGFLPLDQKVKATVFMTHGYGSDTGWLFQKICINFATWGYAVFAADLLGHGRSDGVRCYMGTSRTKLFYMSDRPKPFLFHDFFVLNFMVF